MRDWFEDVVKFHDAFGLTINEKPTIPSEEDRQLRQNLVDEEIKELYAAIEVRNIPEIADAVADSIYVLLGTAITYGIDLRPVWEAVQVSNMEKMGGYKREDGKWVKPPGWKPPDIEEALKQGRVTVHQHEGPLKLIKEDGVCLHQCAMCGVSYILGERNFDCQEPL